MQTLPLFEIPVISFTDLFIVSPYNNSENTLINGIHGQEFSFFFPDKLALIKDEKSMFLSMNLNCIMYI